MMSPTVKIPASAPPDQTRMIDIMNKIRATATRVLDVTFNNATGWPQKGDSVSLVTSSSGRMRKIEGTVVELEPRTSVSLGRLLVRDNVTGALIELPAPETVEA